MTHKTIWDVDKQAVMPVSGLIYAARIHRTGLIKIGFTASIRNRMLDLRSQQRSDVDLLGVVDGTYQDEDTIHKQLVTSRAQIKGREIYHDTEEVRAFIASRLSLPQDLTRDQLHKPTPYKPRKPALCASAKQESQQGKD